MKYKQYYEDVSLKSEPLPTPGPFLAKVIGHLDPTYMGGLEVEILRPVGNMPVAGQLHHVKYMSPFYGVTNASYVAEDPDDFNNTQKSYGMWMIPPDPGTIVIVIFVNGDPKYGYWMGCVQDFGMNFMVPGLAGTEIAVDPEKEDGETLRLPTGEYNYIVNNKDGNPTKFKKPIHPFAAAIKTSGLQHDDIRGVTTSSARRDTPSMVFGISSPGPLDKNGKQGPVGKKEYQIKNAYVSRLGGSTIVMDDGDDKFLRKKKASEDKPEYVSPEQGEKGGDVDIPHNELVRIRTRRGHQILLHNSEDLIYIAHGSGNSWIEMTADGKIDVYAKDSISFHSENDFNFHAKRDITFHAERNFNIKAADMQTDVKNYTIFADKDGNLKFGGNLNADAKRIDLNSGKTKDVKKLTTHDLPTEKKDGKLTSITKRVPTFEPYPQHENLDPKAYKTDKTDRDKPQRTGKENDDSMKKPAESWKKYTITTDTFTKVQGIEQDQGQDQNQGQTQ